MRQRDHFSVLVRKNRLRIIISTLSISPFAPLAGKQVLDAVHAYIEYRDGQRKSAVGSKRRARHLDGTRGSSRFAHFVMFVVFIV